MPFPNHFLQLSSSIGSRSAAKRPLFRNAGLNQEFLDGCVQRGSIEWFCQVTIEPGFQGSLSVSLHCISRKRQHLEASETGILSQLTEDSVAVQHRHLNIQQD